MTTNRRLFALERATTGMGGTYVLDVDVPRATVLEVGALGALEFDPGRYAYVGSAFGPGGFTRVKRHRELASGERDTRHWHVDYLLGHGATTLEAAVTFPDEDRECELACSLPGTVVSGFGASDCGCEGHLVSTPPNTTPAEAATAAGGVLEQF